jgi:hypothetical protein
VGLVVTEDEIECEYGNDTRLDITFDHEAHCVRISVPEVRP